MHKDDKKCWSCGKLTMEPSQEIGNGWLKCSNCGATFLPNQTVSKHIASMDTWKDEDGSHYHPVGVHD